MKNKYLLKVTAALGVFVVVGMFFAIGKVSAAVLDCTWIAPGSGNFNTSANWSGCANSVPTAGDNLIFNNNTLTGSAVVTNNLTANTLFGSITFSGTTNSGFNYTISGNGIGVTMGITDGGATGNNSITAPLLISGNQTISTTSPLKLFNITGALSGSGNLTITMPLLNLLNNSPTYSGSITIANGGYVFINDSGALGDTTGATTIQNGGTLDINFGVISADQVIAENIIMAGSGNAGASTALSLVCSVNPCANALTLSGAITLTADTKIAVDMPTTITGAFSGAFALANLNSTSTLVINSSNNTSNNPNSSFTPALANATLSDAQPAISTWIGNNITIVLDGTRKDVTIVTGGKLMGSGTATGAVIVNAGGTISPGHSPGCLNTGNLTVVGNFDAEIGGNAACTGYDQIKVTGTVDVSGGTLNTTAYNSYVFLPGEKYTIIDNDGSDGITGTFAGLAEGATITVGSQTLTISYVGGDGNDVVLSATATSVTAAAAAAAKAPVTGTRLLVRNSLMQSIGVIVISSLVIGLIGFKQVRSTVTLKNKK